MVNIIRTKLRRRKKAPSVDSVKEYIDASPPSKYNTLSESEDVFFLKKIYEIEINGGRREMCVEKIYDNTFLEKVAKTDRNEYVRLRAAKNFEGIEIIEWLMVNDASSRVRNYAKCIYNKTPNSMKFIMY